MFDMTAPAPTVRPQGELLDLNRSSFYPQAVP